MSLSRVRRKKDRQTWNKMVWNLSACLSRPCSTISHRFHSRFGRYSDRTTPIRSDGLLLSECTCNQLNLGTI